ncbi:hypothetical protein [uncultured Hyphomonas sp.]|uniref:hypothetical protein n=1 Tax=uncultured Hyphomonas sp. TaxID=225298 RepID=UPI002AAB100C|nr:hypothetical protein [uncultured Hyphomonas sp.]
MSFLRPPEGFPPHLACIWPLVWCQLILLRVAVRAAYGQDARYWWSITPNGRVFLTRIHFGLKDTAAREWLKPREHFNDRLAAACDGRAATPVHLRDSTICKERPAPRALTRLSNLHRGERAQLTLPLPET